MSKKKILVVDDSKVASMTTEMILASRYECVSAENGAVAVEMAIAENARMGFPLGAMLDMLACSDAQIYKTVIELIEAGVLSIAR